MVRGFTLIELLITVAMASLMLMIAVPSYASLSEHFKMVRLARSLEGFLHQARSEAVFRHQDLWLHIDIPVSNQSVVDSLSRTSAQSAGGEWQLWLSDSKEINHAPLRLLSGDRYPQIAFSSHIGIDDRILFDGVRGRLSSSGSFRFYPQAHPERELRLVVSSGASRIRVCGQGGKRYGYPAC